MKNSGKKFGSLLIIVSMVMLIACKKEHCLDCFKGTGNIVQETRDPGEFTVIKLSDRINLFLTQDSTAGLVVEAGEHLMGGIITETQDGVLTIRDENSCNWVRSYKKAINVYLNVSNLRNIEYRGAGEVKSLNTLINDTIVMNFWDGSGKISMDVDCRELRVHLHTGCGDAEITGNAVSTYYYSRGNGQILCSGLVSESTFIDSKCTGDIYVNATRKLYAYIGYIGNVYYWGRPPDVESEISERGQLIPME